MSLREKTSYYIERQRHNIVSSNEMTKTIFEYIQLQIEEMMVRPLQQVKFAKEYNGIDEGADMRITVLEEIKELLK